MNVNPTRMELANLKRKLFAARRGRKLLKDKRDELMRRFVDAIGRNKTLRVEVEREIKKADAAMAAVGGVMSDKSVDVALALPKRSISLEASVKNVMSVSTPVFSAQFKTSLESDAYSYGFAETSGELDEAVKAFSDAAPRLIELAELEKTCRLLADEIEKTRRRVNALERVLIPRYEETIKFIAMKLDENERSAAVRLMKIKEETLERAHRYSESAKYWDPAESAV